MDMMEQRSFGIDSQRARELQQVAQEITTKFSDGEEFIDSAVAYFMNMWTDPGVLEEEFFSNSKHMKESLRNEYKAYGTEIASKIEIEEKKISELTVVGFNLIDSTDFRYAVEPSRCEKIEKIFEENEKLIDYLGGRTIKAFLNESIDMFILLWTDYSKVMNKFNKIYSNLPEYVIRHWEKNYPEEFKKFEVQHNNQKNQKKVKKQKNNNFSNTNEFNQFIDDFVKNRKSIKTLCDKIKRPPNSLPINKQAIISQFNTRFFPTKLGLVVLANEINKNNGEPISYEAFSKKFYKIAKNLSEKLKEREEKFFLKRNQKFSTGLPILNKEIDVSEKRFLEFYVGTSEKKWIKRQLSSKYQKDKGLAYFDGALNSFELAYFVPKYDGKHPKLIDGDYKFDGRKNHLYQLQIGITKKGLDFALKKNPIIDDFGELQIDRDKWKKPLSKDESNFIKNEIISKFQLEKLLVKDIKATIRQFSEKHDEKCEDCDSNSYACNHIIDREFHKLMIKNWDLITKSENKMPEKIQFSDIPGWFYGKLNREKLDEDEKTQLVHWRTALIGRLAELDEIKWRIATKETGKIARGTSYYTIPK